MIIKLAAQIIFYLLVGILGIYSMMMVYVLLRYGKSKILSLAVSALFLIAIATLYAAAQANFNLLTFPELELL